MTAPTRLWDRWAARRAGASPFGIGLRPAAPGAAPPFATWPYRPSYMPAGLSIDMATDTPLGEPELFFLAAARGRPDFRELAARHAAAVGPLTSVTIELPGAPSLSPACAAVQAAGVVRFAPAARHALRLGFGTPPPGAAPTSARRCRSRLTGSAARPARQPSMSRPSRTRPVKRICAFSGSGW